MQIIKKHILISITIVCAFFIAWYVVDRADIADVFFGPDKYSKVLDSTYSSEQISFTNTVGQSHVFDVLIADTDELKKRGLGDRNSLGEKEAMLFVFNEDEKHYFWMKDMNFPIDIVWLNADKKVIYIERNVATSTYPEVFGPKEKSRYVIELNAGISDKVKLQAGDVFNF